MNTQIISGSLVAPNTTGKALPVSIHSHVQGPVLAEGEASLRLIQLNGGAASVQQDGINAAWLNVHVRQQGFKLTEPAEQRLHMTAGGFRKDIM